MQTIWKYELKVDDAQAVEMPAGAKIRHVAMQHSQPCIWAQVDDQAPLVRRMLSVHGTGHPVKPFDRGDGNGGVYPLYVGTFMVYVGTFVFHVFDYGELP